MSGPVHSSGFRLICPTVEREEKEEEEERKRERKISQRDGKKVYRAENGNVKTYSQTYVNDSNAFSAFPTVVSFRLKILHFQGCLVKDRRVKRTGSLTVIKWTLRFIDIY